MSTFSIKRIFTGCALSAMACGLLSCGGSGSDNPTEAAQSLPVGSRLDLIMNDSSAGRAYTLTLDVLNNGYGQVQWVSKTSLSGYTAFTYYRTGMEGVFTTSFVYRDGTYIAPGPVIVTDTAMAEIQAKMKLPEDVDKNTYGRTFSGSCTYRIVIEAFETSGDESGTHAGNGSYKITQ